MALIKLFFFPGGTEVITEDDYQNGHPDLEAASSGRLGVGRDKMVYMAVKNHPKEEEDDEDDSDDDDDDDISMFLCEAAFSQFDDKMTHFNNNMFLTVSGQFVQLMSQLGYM